MPRKSDVLSTDDVAVLTAEDWQAQTPCSECGGRPGQSPSGVTLRIKLPNGEFVDGHTYQCQKRRQE